MSLETSEAMPLARIQSVLPSLQPSEKRVVEVIRANPEQIVEITAQELADLAGVGRSSVIRTCQTLGYRGYPQLRVALAKELAQFPRALSEANGTSLGEILQSVANSNNSLTQISAFLDEETIEEVLSTFIEAKRLLVIAAGLSTPLGLAASLHLTAAGRPAEFVIDGIGQQIAASQLGPGNCCFVVSGSGSNEASLKAARAAKRSGAKVIVLTTFAKSPLAALADLTVIVASSGDSFRQELEHTSRVPHLALVEALVEALTQRIDPSHTGVKAQVLEILSDNLSD